MVTATYLDSLGKLSHLEIEVFESYVSQKYFIQCKGIMLLGCLELCAQNSIFKAVVSLFLYAFSSLIRLGLSFFFA